MKNKGILQNKPIKKINIFPFLINRLPKFSLCIIIIYYRPVSIKKGNFRRFCFIPDWRPIYTTLLLYWEGKHFVFKIVSNLIS